MPVPLRFAILGCGTISGAHAEAIDSLPDARLIAAADADPERARRLADRFGATPYGSLEAMLGGEQIDVVNICTSSGEHGKHACAAMRSGSHVIVEKPMEIRREAIDEMLKVQAQTRKKLSVISQRRFEPAVQQIHALIQEGALGKLILGNAQVLWWRSQAYYDGADWRGTWALDGGGVVMNQSIHSIDLLTWLMGPVHSVFARTVTRAHRMQTEDTAVATLYFQSGALGSLAATTAAYPGITTRLEILGAGGSAVIENDRLSFLHVGRDDEAEVGPYGREMQDWRASAPPPTPSPGVSPHALQIQDVMRAIREDGTPLVDGVAGRHAVDIILSIYESSRTGRAVIVP